jgi:hypothetical protein
MGFATAHGQAMSVMSALKKFGLVCESNGRIVPTQRAIEIINLQPEDPRRLKALREAALEPTIYSELIEQHRETGLPDPEVLESELVTYRNFNPNAVAGFVKDFKDSLEFAGLSCQSALDYVGSEASAEWVRPKIGDYVQWESGGVLQLPGPKRVRALSDDGAYAFVEGSSTGLPVKDLIIEDRPESPELLPGIPLRSQTFPPGVLKPISLRQDVFSLAEGQVALQWPTGLSQESIEDLQDWLDLMKRKIARAQKSDSTS